MQIDWNWRHIRAKSLNKNSMLHS